MMIQSILVVLACLATLPVRAEGGKSFPLWVDIRDMVDTSKNHPGFKVHPISKIVYDKLISNPAQFVPEGVTFEAQGPRGPDFGKVCDDDGSNCRTKRLKENRNSRVAKIYGVEFSGEPSLFKGPETFIIPVNLFFNKEPNVFLFRKLELIVDIKNVSVEVLRFTDIPLESTKFEMRVGLIQRKIVLEDISNGIKKVYPIGVGAVDEGVANKEGIYRLLTPQHSMASLNDKYNYPEVVNPSYFKARPYVAVVNEKGERTSIAFHYQIDAIFNRGFVSHGCVRVRDKDLYELHFIVKTLKQLPLKMANDLPDIENHPYKYLDNKYHRVDLPVRRDKSGLLVTEWHAEIIPVDQIRSGFRPKGDKGKSVEDEPIDVMAK